VSRQGIEHEHQKDQREPSRAFRVSEQWSHDGVSSLRMRVDFVSGLRLGLYIQELPKTHEASLPPYQTSSRCEEDGRDGAPACGICAGPGSAATSARPARRRHVRQPWHR
jgi:hypothetical protein